MSVVQIDYVSWLSSFQKWSGIYTRTVNQMCFCNERGFSDFAVISDCGYCRYQKQFHTEMDVICGGCYLYKRWLCDMTNAPLCFYNSNIMPMPFFWRYIGEMQKKTPDFEKAVNYARLIKDAIWVDRFRT